MTVVLHLGLCGQLVLYIVVQAPEHVNEGAPYQKHDSVEKDATRKPSYQKKKHVKELVRVKY